MHSKNRESNEMWKRALATTGLTLVALALTGAAEAHEWSPRHRHGHGYHEDVRHHGRASVREARRYDRRLDRRGEVIDFQLDLLAMVAAANGEYALAEHLDRKGDRIERRLDRKGDRALRNTRIDRRYDRHHRFDRNWNERERRFDRNWNERERCLEKKRERERRLDRKIARERERERRLERELAFERERNRDREQRIERERRHERRVERDGDLRISRQRDRREDRSHVDALSHLALRRGR